MKIGIIGGNGMLGKNLSLLLTSEGFESNVFDLPEYNITKETDLQKMIRRSDVIVNCAAYTAVDKAESDIEKCYTINAEAVGKLGRLAAEAGKYLIHISTDLFLEIIPFNPSMRNPLQIR